MVMTARRAGGLSTSRAIVDGVPADGRSTNDILRAADACDFVHAAVLALSRASAGDPVPAEIITQVLPGIRDATLAASLCAVATGDRAQAWIACVRERMFPVSSHASPCEAVVLYAAWRAGAPAADIAPEVRRLTRMQVGGIGFALLYTLGQGLGDANVEEATRHLRVVRTWGPGAKCVATIDHVLASNAAEIIDALPVETLAPPIAAGFTIRVAPRAGRNDPCPCGSGQKFKRCCADKAPQLAPSPIAGLSWDEYVTGAGDKMSVEDIRGLPLRDLGRVRLQTLRDMPLVTAVGRFTRERIFMKATRALSELSRRNVDFVDDLREEIIDEALDATDFDTAATQLACITDPSKAALHRLELDLVRGHDTALQRLTASAEHAVREDDGSDAFDLAHALLRASPALGILVARGCLRASGAVVNDNLLGGIEEARDALNLPSGDPAWDTYSALNGEVIEADDPDPDQALVEADQLRGSLRAASQRLEDLEAQLATKQAALEDARHSNVQPEPDRDIEADRERTRALRFKVEHLEGLIREGNVERADLRRQLATRTVAKDALPRPSERDPDTDDADSVEDLETVDDVGRDLAVPVLDRRVQDALRDLPRSVGAEALRTIGSLAAGDSSAWRRVKQAKDMPRQTLMARVGIHHRLIFRIDSRRLEAIDLVTRESLLATIKRLRAS